MVDPNFAATVVYLFETDADGSAAGVILNRPSDIGVADALPSLSALAAPPEVVFLGGPVQTEHALVLSERAGSIRVSAFDEVETGDRVRVFAGYSGWGSGQLTAEITQGGWFVVESDPTDPFTDDPMSLWRHIFARQSGTLRRYRTYPDDPRSN